MLIIGSIRQLIWHSFDFIVYGGEMLAYKKKNSYKMITEVYSKLEDLLEGKNNA